MSQQPCNKIGCQGRQQTKSPEQRDKANDAFIDMVYALFPPAGFILKHPWMFIASPVCCVCCSMCFSMLIILSAK